jgi:hypothetical protein
MPFAFRAGGRRWLTARVKRRERRATQGGKIRIKASPERAADVIDKDLPPSRASNLVHAIPGVALRSTPGYFPWAPAGKKGKMLKAALH